VVSNNEQTETYYTTAEHPFWIKDHGWRKASLLETGMVLLDRDNEPLEVVSQQLTNDLDTVFNIQVQDAETYHIGELGVWVHNADCCLIKAKADAEFEKKLYNLPPGERVALIKTEAKTAAKDLNLVKDNRLSKMNGRDVYKGKDGNLYSLDTQHGRWESINSKTGAHQGEVTLKNLTPIPNSLDVSGSHNLKVK
jgi:filamentous hemagglutinin